MFRSEPHSVLDLGSNLAFSPGANGQSAPLSLFLSTTFPDRWKVIDWRLYQPWSAVHLPLHEALQKISHSESSPKCKYLIVLISHLCYKWNAGVDVSDVKCFIFNRGTHLALTPFVSRYKIPSSFTLKGADNSIPKPQLHLIFCISQFSFIFIPVTPRPTLSW